jgi:cytochrome P450
MNITREPNRHVAFGFGIHTCAGLSLARLKARVAMSRALSRFPYTSGARRSLTGKGTLPFSARGKRCRLQSTNLPVPPP